MPKWLFSDFISSNTFTLVKNNFYKLNMSFTPTKPILRPVSTLRSFFALFPDILDFASKKYTKADLQYILKIILDARPLLTLTFILALILAQYNYSRKYFLKARFFNLYFDKLYIDYYYFC